MNSLEISPQAIYDATRTDSNLVDLKAKEKLNFSNFFGKNKKEESEDDDQEEEQDLNRNLIPAFEEDV